MQKEQRQIDVIAEKFLHWNLPESVCVDPCAMTHGQEGRTGTNLLTFDEAKQMLEHLFPDGIPSQGLVKAAHKISSDIACGLLVQNKDNSDKAFEDVHGHMQSLNEELERSFRQ